MKRYSVFTAFVFFLLGVLLLQPGEAGIIPSYYSLLDYNLTSPGASATAVGGFANPAVYRMLPGGELTYFWSDKRASLRSLNRWGLFLGTPHLGFTALRNRMQEGDGTWAGVVDYRLSMALGSKSTALGLAFGWSSGDEKKLGRTNIIQLGAMRRFGRFVSFGLSGTFSSEESDRTGLADLALRPFGSEKLTIFGDGELAKNTALRDARWSAGAVAEVLPGVNLVGRYFDDESFAFSLGFSFGKVGAAASSRFDKNSDLDYTLYGIRLGYGQANIVDTYLEKDKRYLEMNLKGEVRYRKYRLFDEGAPTFYDIVSALEDARNDGRVKGVAINLSGTEITREKAWEIREKLKELERAGKGVVIFIDRADMTLYHLASVADRVVMDPDGVIELPGYVAGRTFLKDLIAKLGLGFDEWRFYKYKSAAEVLSRDDMSDADKEQRLAMIEDFYNTVRRDVSTSRGISGIEFDEWVNDHWLFMPDSALACGLVDKLGRWEDIKEVIVELEGSQKRYMSPRNLAARAFPSQLWGENPEIALVYGLGECAMDKGIRARKLEKVFNKIRDDRGIKAVVFRVDSPGGDGMASDIVAQAVQKCSKKKPVIVTQGDVAGSGGYWISMYGDTIIAGPQTITGSIGVIGGWIWNKGIGEKMGLVSDHVQVGKHADMGFGIVIPFLGIMIPDRNLTDEEYSWAEHYIKEYYKEFVRKVAKGRKMSVEEVMRVGQGRVWSGVDGKEKGLVDMIGGLDTAINVARQAAGLNVDDKVDIVEYPKMHWYDLGFLEEAKPSLFSLKSKPVPYEGYEESYIRALLKSEGRPLYMVAPEDLVYW